MLLFGGLADWGYIANIVLAVMSVFTAIVTARMLIKQYKLDKEKFEVQQLEHQPEFQLIKNDICTNLEIHNNSEYICDAIVIDELTIMCIEIRTKYSYRIMCVPIQYYTAYDGLSQRHKGELALYDSNLNQKGKLRQKENKIRTILSDKFGENAIKITNADLIKISYNDMYGKNRHLYYFDINRTSKKHIDKYWKLAEKFSKDPIEIDNLDIQEIADSAIAMKKSFKL